MSLILYSNRFLEFSLPSYLKPDTGISWHLCGVVLSLKIALRPFKAVMMAEQETLTLITDMRGTFAAVWPREDSIDLICG